jgi:hypothetical protein
LQRWIGDAELIRISEMDTCLIAWLDRNTNVGNGRRHAVDDCVLGLPGGVCVEMEDIVILDAVIRRTPSEDVPYCLNTDPETSQASVRPNPGRRSRMI